ncbi:GAP1-N2 domain-containing protein [Litchfieldia alkalitelluris]|uniref:GAP1-N2 domain-containing protein n=1 Tax=Litchfieldia alkalitelluris TaxID=304268 RepID=UPI0009963815|nr:hypothetical protein [Litchfieldia alkalitelluris]
MSFLHLYYTSSKTGMNGGSGFQTYSMSPGISPEEKEEIERIGMYTPPNGLSQMADVETIENTYPKSFYYYPLKSGRYAIGVSQYVGKDYSGRYGNYFSDTVVFEKNDLRGLPMEYFKSHGFRAKLTKEEEESLERPLPLPITLQLLKGEYINKRSVLQFLKEGNRSEQLKQLISAIIGYHIDKRRIVIIDKSENISFWIGAVQYVLPEGLAAQIPFTTYTNDPMRQNALICGVHDGEVPSPIWNQQFYVFDFLRQNLSSTDSTRYAETVVDLFMNDRDELDQFLSFVGISGWNRIDKHLDELLQLYKLVVHGPQSIDRDELREAVSIVSKLDHQKGLVAITDKLLKSWGRNSDELTGFVLDVPSDLMGEITDWWFKVADLSKQKEHMILATTFFFNSWTQLLIEKGEQHQETMSYYKGIMETNKNNRSFSMIALSPNRLTGVYVYCKTENPKLMPLFLTDFVLHAKRLKLDWKELDEEQRSYLLKMLNLAVEHKIDLADICQHLGQLEQTFLQTVANLMEIYRKTDQLDNGTYLLTSCVLGIEEGVVNGKHFSKLILQNEYVEEAMFKVLKTLIKDSKKPITRLNQLHTIIFAHSNEFHEMSLKLLVEGTNDLLKALVDETNIQETQVLLSSKNLMNLLSETKRIKLIEIIEQRLPFSDDISHFSSLLKELEIQRSHLSTKSSSNISLLLMELLELDKAKEIKTDFLSFLNKQVGSLTKTQYEDLLLWRLPLMIQLVQKKTRLLVMLFDALHCSENNDVFFKSLIKEPTRSGKSDKSIVLAAFCCCLIKHKKKLSESEIDYFEQNRSLFKKVKDEASKLPNGEQTDAYLAKIQVNFPEQKDGSIFGKMKSMLKVRKNEG